MSRRYTLLERLALAGVFGLFGVVAAFSAAFAQPYEPGPTERPFQGHDGYCYGP